MPFISICYTHPPQKKAPYFITKKQAKNRPSVITNPFWLMAFKYSCHQSRSMLTYLTMVIKDVLIEVSTEPHYFYHHLGRVTVDEAFYWYRILFTAPSMTMGCGARNIPSTVRRSHDHASTYITNRARYIGFPHNAAWPSHHRWRQRRL